MEKFSCFSLNINSLITKYYVINKTRLHEYENNARISMKRDGMFKQMCRQETNLHFEKRHYKIN